MNRSKPFNAYLGGMRYGGWYEVADGQLMVSSAYGPKSAKQGKADPEKLAQRLLAEIVQAKQ